MTEQEIRQLAARFFDAVAAGDLDGVRACYATDAVVWHNTDEIEQTREENLATLAQFVRLIPERRYEDRRVEVFADGFVQQHVLRGRRRDGVEVALPAVIVVRLADGMIVRLDEYLDSAQVARFIGRVAD